MRSRVLVLLLALVAGDDPKATEELEGQWRQKQLGFLEPPAGIWKLIYGHELSLDDPSALIRDRSALSIRGEKVTFKNGEHEEEVKFRLDPTKTPKTVDILIDNKPKYLGVYEVKDGELRLGFGDGKTRPKKPEIEEGETGRVFLVLDLVKPKG